MSCKQCEDLIGLPSEWHAHNRLEAPGTARTLGYESSLFQKLYACKTCHTVLRRGKNTGWALAVKTT